MSKKLSEMTLQELWQLFPIQLCPHDDKWEDMYIEEHRTLSSQLPLGVRIHHIGSTAVRGIWAKPIVDILVEAERQDFEIIEDILTGCGYLCMARDACTRDYNKGYTENGFADRVFHLHLRIFGDNDELYFRDYLNDHPDAAREYEKLKLSLWKPFEHDRDGYTRSKGNFIKEHTDKAKKEYGNIY